MGLAAVGGEGVEDRNGAPVPVESQEGNGQVGLTLGHRGQDREAVDEGAVGRVGVGVGGEGRLRRDGHRRGDNASAGHGDRRGVSAAANVARVADRDALVGPVGAVLGEDAGGDDLGESLRVQPVGACLVGGVGQANGERPALGSVPEVGLGPRLVGRVHDGGEHGGGGGRHRVGQAGADLARRVVGAAAALVVDQRLGRAHEEVVDDARLLGLGHVGETGVGLHALLDVGGHARQVGGRHGGAGGVAVGAARQRRPDVSAGRGDFGLEGQVGGHAPGGEARRLVGGGTPPVGVIDGGDRQGRRVGGGLGDRRRIGVGGVGQAPAAGVALGGGAEVAARDVEHDALFGQAVVDGPVGVVAGFRGAARVSEGHVDDVGLEDRAVVQGGEDRRVGEASRGVDSGLHEQQLRAGCGPQDRSAVRGRDARDVRAVGHVVNRVRDDVGVAVAVVVGEGDLRRHVGARPARAQASLDRGDRVV